MYRKDGPRFRALVDETLTKVRKSGEIARSTNWTPSGSSDRFRLAA
jgi:hypothetical protein